MNPNFLILIAAYVFFDALLHPSTDIPYSVRKEYQITLRLGAGTFGEVSLVFNKVSDLFYLHVFL